jgi:hypothetical protein
MKATQLLKLTISVSDLEKTIGEPNSPTDATEVLLCVNSHLLLFELLKSVVYWLRYVVRSASACSLCCSMGELEEFALKSRLGSITCCTIENMSLF